MDTATGKLNAAEEGAEASSVPFNPIGIRMVVGMLLLAGGAHLASHFILAGGMAMLLASSVVLGWFVYEHLIEWRMFARRAVAEVGFEESGFIHRMLSKGRLTRLVLFFLSVVFSGSFLLHANQMPLYIWGFIYLDALIIAALLRLTRRQVAAQARSGAVGIVGRHYVFWLNVLVLSALVCLTSLFVPVDDLRNFSLIESFTRAWIPIWQHTANPLVAFWGAAIAGLDAMAWNIMQQISQLQVSGIAKLAGWIVFFLLQSLYLWLIQAAMLGTLAVGKRTKSWPDRLLGESREAKAGWGTFYLLVAIWLGLSLALDSQQPVRSSFPLNISESAPTKVVIDLCKDRGSQAGAAVAATMDQQIADEKKKYVDDIDARIDTQIDAAFGHALNGVDAYLNWYFTVAGEWQRLATVVVGDAASLMQEKMHDLVEDKSGFTTARESAGTDIISFAGERFTQSTKRIISVARQQVDIHPCSIDQTIDVALPSLSRDLDRIALATSATAAAGAAIIKATGAAITTKLAATASAKMAAKALAKAAAKTAAKTAGGMAGASAGAFTGLACGPYAPICSSVLAVAGFFGMDALFMEGDELINRDDMRSDMVNSLVNQREETKVRLKEQYHKVGADFFAQVTKKTHAQFVPVRNGI